QAIQKDANYALAYAGMADSWFTTAWYRCMDPKESSERARAAANRALAINDKLAEPHATLAMIKGNYDFDWAGAETEFKLAIKLNPNYPTAHHRYSLYLPIFGRFDEAIAEAKRAQQLDPLSLILNENLGDVLLLARRYDEAEAQLRKTLELDPDFFVARSTLARLYETRGRYKEALELDLKGEDPEEVRHVMKIFNESGMKGVRQANLEWVLERAKKERVSPNRLAQAYV